MVRCPLGERPSILNTVYNLLIYNWIEIQKVAPGGTSLDSGGTSLDS